MGTPIMSRREFTKQLILLIVFGFIGVLVYSIIQKRSQKSHIGNNDKSVSEGK